MLWLNQNGELKETIVRYDKSGNEVLVRSYLEDDDYNYILLSDSEVVVRIGDNIIQEGKVEDDGVLEYLRKSTEDPFTGVLISYHDNGNLKDRFFVLDGILDGPVEIYYEDGQLKIRGSLKYGEENGPVEFYENGRLVSKGSMKDGKPSWPWEYYYESGELMTIGSYKDGQQLGIWNIYRENGQVLSPTCYQNGEEVDLTVCESK